MPSVFWIKHPSLRHACFVREVFNNDDIVQEKADSLERR